MVRLAPPVNQDHLLHRARGARKVDHSLDYKELRTRAVNHIPRNAVALVPRNLRDRPRRPRLSTASRAVRISLANLDLVEGQDSVVDRASASHSVRISQAVQDSLVAPGSVNRDSNVRTILVPLVTTAAFPRTPGSDPGTKSV